MLLLGLSIIIGCSKETDPKPEPKPQPEEKATLTVAPTSLTFENTGDSQSISITTNKAWTISSSQSWCKVSQSSGNATGSSSVNITVTCEENTTYDDRTCTLTVKAGTASQTVEVKQGEGLGLVISQTTYNVSNDAQTIEVEVKANVEYEYTIAEDAKDWITVSETKALVSSKVKFDIAANESYDDREGVITFKQKDGSLAGTVAVKQSAEGGLIITQAEYDLSNEAQSIEVEVKANVEYEYAIAEDAKDWITVSGTKALVSSKVKFDIAANESYDDREGVITFKQKDGPLAGTVTVKQGEEKGLIITKTSYELSDKEQTIEVEVKANVEYEYHIAEDAIDWITPVETKALVPSKIMFTIAANETYDSRSAEITIKSSDGSMSGTITVTQMQKGAIIVSKEEYTFDRLGGDFDINVDHSVDFSIKISSDWIKIIETKSLNSSIVSFTVSENTNSSDREATIVFTSADENVEQKITVRQSSECEIIAYLTTPRNEGNIVVLPYYYDTSFDIVINPKISYDVIVSDDTPWISTYDYGKHSVMVTCTGNYSEDSRQGLVIIRDLTTQQKDTVIVIQKAKDIYEELQFEYFCSRHKGGIKINFRTNVNYTIKLRSATDESGSYWINQVETKSVADHSLNFAVEENKSEYSRQAQVDFIDPEGNEVMGFLITQYGSVFQGDYKIASEKDILFIDEMDFVGINGDLEVTSVESISELNNKITVISGSLTTSGLANFDGLYGLTEVAKNLTIKDSKSPSTEGLNNLARIGGNLSSYKEVDFSSMEKLVEIGGSLTVKGVESFNGLQHLSTIGGDFSAEQVQSFVGLNNLTNIEGDFNIKNSSISFEGLTQLQNIGGSFDISGCEFSSFNGLQSLRTIGGSFVIDAHADNPKEILPSVVKSLDDLTTLSDLVSLQSIGHNFEIRAWCSAKFSPDYSRTYCLNNLSSIDIPSLTFVGNYVIISARFTADGGSTSSDEVYLYALNSLSDISFSSLNKIGGGIIIEGQGNQNQKTSNYKEIYATGIPTITRANIPIAEIKSIDFIYSFNNDSDGFLDLKTITGDMKAGYTEKGFPSLTEIQGNLDYSRHSESSINFYPHLSKIGGDCIIHQLSITDINGPQSSLSIIGTLSIENNSNLKAISGLANIEKSGKVNIDNCPLLYDFSPLVNCVNNGCSWYVNGCGYNPTKYQMQNGESKPE